MTPPLNETFIHRQTTANQVRFTTVELSEIETRILNAGGRALEIEKRLYSSLTGAIIAQAGPLGALARALSEFDLMASMAHLAVAENWVRPKVDDSRAFEISGGRHPVVEAALQKDGAQRRCRKGVERYAQLTGECIAPRAWREAARQWNGVPVRWQNHLKVSCSMRIERIEGA